MKRFAGKTAASADKVRGGYYTPAPVARFLAGWVREGGPRILEPSCGDGRILRELATLTGRAHGVELDAHEAAKSREFAPVDAEDLFTWLPSTEAGGWDGVAGNPPYIRFGNWASGQREPALELMTASRPAPHQVDQCLGPLRRRKHNPGAPRWPGGPGTALPNCSRSATPRSCANFCSVTSPRSPF